MRELGFKALGAAGYVSSTAYFSIFLKIQARRLKTEVTLSLILRFNLRLGATPYGARVHRASYKRRFRGLSTSQPRSNRKYLEDYSKHSIGSSEPLDEMFRALEALEDAFRSTRLLQDSAMKSSGACQTRAAGLLIGKECSRVRDSLWMYLTSLVTTRLGSGLRVQMGRSTFLCCGRFKELQENILGNHISSLWSSKSHDQRWRLTLHRQNLPQRARSRPPGCNTISSPNKWSGRDV